MSRHLNTISRNIIHVSQETISRTLHAMRRYKKSTNGSLPHHLNERQMENRKITWEMLIYYQTPKWKKLRHSSIEAGLPPPSPNLFAEKTILCVCWNQSDIVNYELLKTGETGNAPRYWQQEINLNYAIVETTEMDTAMSHLTKQNQWKIPWNNLRIRAFNRALGNRVLERI